MARVTSTTRMLHDNLVAQCAWTGSLGQLQQAVESRLGPIPGDSDPVGHWRAVDALITGASRRLPNRDAAAVDLAESGHPCLGLVGAVRRIVAAREPDRNPEDVAEELMTLRAEGDETSYGAHLARRMRAGAVPRPGSTGEEAMLEALGQAQAVATEMGEVANGACPVEVLDADDVAQVLGMPAELVRAYIPAFAATFGPTGVMEHVDQLVEGADPAALAAAVKGAAGLVPLYEELIGRLGSPSNRRKWIAAVAPILLRAGDLYGAVAAALGGPEAAAASPSMLDPRSPALARAESALRAFMA